MKKILLPLLVPLLFTACNSTTEDELKEALLNIEKQQLAAKGEQVESISIDSVEYVATSEKVQLQFHSVFFNTDNIDKSDKANSQAEFDQIMDDQKHKADSLQQVIDHADTTLSLYDVSYMLKAKTDKRSYNDRKKMYLNSSTMKEFTLPGFSK